MRKADSVRRLAESTGDIATHPRADEALVLAVKNADLHGRAGRHPRPPDGPQPAGRQRPPGPHPAAPGPCESWRKQVAGIDRATGDMVGRQPDSVNLFQVVEAANALCQRFGNNRVGCEHLLIAVLARPNCYGYQFLTEMNRVPLAIEMDLMARCGTPGYTHSYLTGVPFWEAHWNTWTAEEPELGMHQWRTGFVQGREDVVFSARCEGVGIGVVLTSTPRPADGAGFEVIDGAQCLVVGCDEPAVHFARVLCVNYLVARLVFPDLKVDEGTTRQPRVVPSSLANQIVLGLDEAGFFADLDSKSRTAATKFVANEIILYLRRMGQVRE
jgi:hypothetical protein